MIEFGIIDDKGELFGLPARTFDSLEAAKSTFDFLVQRRADMKRESYQAELALAEGVKDVAEGHRLQEVMARWGGERDRRFYIVRREVGEWVKA